MHRWNFPLFLGLTLLAGAMAGLSADDVLRLTVKNDLAMARPNETVVLSWELLRQAMPALPPGRLQVRDAAIRQPVVCQEVDWTGDGTPEELVFQAGFAAGEAKDFLVGAGEAIPGASMVYGRQVPERKDDFAWENDRIAFRMYGRRLEDELVSSGVDIWCKRTRALVIDRWYQKADYHTDRGEGLDCYTVGKARGCGGTAIYQEGKLLASRNFTQSRVLANGPIRFVFELTYEPWDAGGIRVAETKRITLDAGSQLSRYDCVFSGDAASAGLAVALGLQKHAGAQTVLRREEGWMRVWEGTASKTAGSLGVGLVLASPPAAEMKEVADHALAIVPAKGRPVVFHAGAGWEKSGDFPNPQAWDDYLSRCARSLRSPLQITLHRP